MVLAVIVMGAIYIRPSELLVEVRYSDFSQAGFYRDKWYYLLSFVVFAVGIGVAHSAIAAKIYRLKGRVAAISFLWLSVAILLVAAVYIRAILNIVKLSQ